MENRAKKLAGSRRGADRFSRSEFESRVMCAISGLLAKPDPRPTIVAVADQLSMNVRTLQRRLECVGISFRSLLSECRRQRALQELSEIERSISEVSIRLGYSDPAHFTRAFRQWIGHSPSEYRRRTLRR